MENNSGLEPRGVAVLIQLYEPERQGAKIVIPDMVQSRMSMADTRAIVIAIGPSAWNDEPSPRAKVGDKVLVTKFAGMTAVGPNDGAAYRLVNDRDIFCAIVKEAA
tara:strand:+ start:775 stop:1092 length:318 start_codon:yes stop_codon:yes gene_type:complete